jgi:spermidine/putrescine transport system substrate-binding protein
MLTKKQKFGPAPGQGYLWLVLIVCLSLIGLLAACGGAATPAPAPESNAAPTEAATAEVAAPASPATEEAAAATEPPSESKGKIVISNWDAYMPEDLLTNFTKETGIEVELALHATNEEIVGKLVASGGQGYDLVFMSGQFAQALGKQGLLAEIDKSKIPNAANLYPEVSQMPFDPGNKYSIPYTWGTTGLCYRSDLIDFTPESWYDLLTPKDELKGKTTMLQTERWLMLPAQKALGYSANTTSEEEMQKVADLLKEAKQTLLAYDDTTFYSKLVSGEAVLVEAWDGWCNYGIAENDKIKFVIPKEGSDLWVDTMVIMEASPNKDAAHQFIDYVLRPEIGQWVASNIMYKVPTQTTMETLDKAMIEQFPNLGMAPADLLKQENLQDLGEAQTMYTRLATEIVASQ